MRQRFPAETLILNCRASHQAAALSAALREAGAEVLEIPAIEIELLPLSAAALNDIAALTPDDFLAMTSSNAVRALAASMNSELRANLREIEVGLVGEATANEMRAAELPVGFIAEESSAAGLGAAMSQRIHNRGRASKVVFLRGDTAGPDFRAAVGGGLAEPELIEHTVYRSIVRADLERRMRAAQKAFASLSGCVFMNPLAAVAVSESAQKIEGLFQELKLLPVVAAGRRSAEQARKCGFENVTSSVDPGVAGVVSTLVQIL